MTKEELKQYIDDNIYENQDGEITGEALNEVLKAIVDDGGTEVEANPAGEATTPLNKIKIGETIYEIPKTNLPEGLLYGGEVYPNTVITPDIHCYYIANGSGNYISFGNALVGPSEKISYLYYDGSNEQWDYSEFDTYKYGYAESKFNQVTELDESTIQVNSVQDFTNAERLQALANVSNQEAGYESEVFTGKMGYVVLQPQDDKDLEHTSFAAQIANKPNTIFEIRDVFDLDDDEVEIPANCTLKFNGGVVKNGSIDFNGCYIDGDKPQLLNIEPSGMVANDKLQPQVFGAKGDGVTDDTKAIRNALKVCNHVFVPDGNYGVTQYHDGGFLTSKQTEENGALFNAITITRSNVTLELSEKAVVFALSIDDEQTAATGNKFTALLYVLGDATIGSGVVTEYTPVKNVTIKGGSFVGNRSMFNQADYDSYVRENYAGIVCAYVNGLTIKGCKVTDNTGDGIYIAPSWNTVIDGVETSRNRRCSIGIGVVDGFEVKNCYFHDEMQEVTYPNGNTNGTSIYQGIIVTEPEPSVFIASISDDAEKNVTVRNCIFDAGGFKTFFAGYVENLYIENNKVFNVDFNAVGSNNNIIRVSPTGSGDAVTKSHSRNINIKNNLIIVNKLDEYSQSDAYKYAIFIINEGDCKIEGNTVENYGFCNLYRSFENTNIDIVNNNTNWFTGIFIGNSSINYPTNVRIKISDNSFKCDKLIGNQYKTTTIADSEIVFKNNIVRTIAYVNSLGRLLEDGFLFGYLPVSTIKLINNDILFRCQSLIVVNGTRNIFVEANSIVARPNIPANFQPFRGSSGSDNPIWNGTLIGNVINFTKQMPKQNTTPDVKYVCMNNVFTDIYNSAIVDGISPKVTNIGNVFFKRSNISTVGATSDRPTGLTSDDEGFQYFDTTLLKSIYWNGSLWVDSTGLAIKDGIGHSSDKPNIEYSGFQYYDIDNNELLISSYNGSTLTWVTASGSYIVFNNTNKQLLKSLPFDNKLLPNVFYDLGYVGNDITIDLATPENNAILNEYDVMFFVGDYIPTINWGTWLWSDGTPPILQQFHIYSIHITNNVAKVESTDVGATSNNELCFTAVEPNSTLKLQKIQNGATPPPDISLEYSFDGDNWLAYNFDGNNGDTITLPNLGSRVFMRSTVDTYKSLANYYNDRYHQFIMTGRIAASGDLTSLLKKSGNVLELQSYALAYLFMDCSQLVSAPSIPSTSIKANNTGAMRSLFHGCSSLRSAPEIFITTLASDALYNTFNNCTNLNYIKVHITSISAANAILNWVYGVQTNEGSFYCDQNLVITSGVSGIPNNWTRYNLDGTPWEDPNAE